METVWKQFFSTVSIVFCIIESESQKKKVKKNYVETVWKQFCQTVSMKNKWGGANPLDDSKKWGSDFQKCVWKQFKN